MTSATLAPGRREPAELVGVGMGVDGMPFFAFASASELGAVRLVHEDGPAGVLRCDCPAGSFGKRCRHVAAAALEVLREARAERDERKATAAALEAAHAAQAQRTQDIYGW